MNKLIRYYNQNRFKIWVFIIVIVFIILIIQLLNNIAKRQNEETLENINKIETSNTDNNTQDQNNQIVIKNNEKNLSKTDINLINEFVKYCNNNEIDKAYDMLSDDCKTVLYPTANEFKLKYVQKIFNKTKTAEVEESIYNSLIYKITFYDDLLSSGSYNQNNVIQDYIKIVYDNNEKRKISLNKFVELKTINKIENNKSAYVKIIQKQIYINYEVYQVQITNRTENDMTLYSNDIYIIDENQIQYRANINSKSQYTIKAGNTEIVNITFNKLFNNNKNIKSIMFSNITYGDEKTDILIDL